MVIKIHWLDIHGHHATAHLVDNNGSQIRCYDIPNVKEFIDEYYLEKTRPLPPSPYWTRDGHIATLNHYLQLVEDALKEPDDAVKLAKIKEAITELNTPVAVA
jgi:hypothetical protein